MIFLLYILVLFQFSYAQNCPEVETSTEQYVQVDLYPDLQSLGAVAESIPNLNLHLEEREQYKDLKLKIFYRLWKPFDPNKETIVFILGGPGQTSEFISTWIPLYQPRINNYNVIMMDHRGVGCSRQLFYQHMPPTSFKMRFAAADLEVIRKKHLGNKPWHVDGGSYGSGLALTYALLFPQNVDKLMVWGVYSSHLDVRLARRTYFSRLISVFPNLKMQLKELDYYDARLTPAFLRWSSSKMFGGARTRPEIPVMMTRLLALLKEGKQEEARSLLPGERVYQAPYMQNNIVCLELEPYPLLMGEFRFYSPLDSCQVFAGYYDYFHYTPLLQSIQHRTLFWQGELDPFYDPESSNEIASLLPNDFYFLVPGQGHGISNLRDCYNDIYFDFLGGSTNEELEKYKSKEYCLKNRLSL